MWVNSIYLAFTRREKREDVRVSLFSLSFDSFFLFVLARFWRRNEERREQKMCRASKSTAKEDDDEDEYRVVFHRKRKETVSKRGMWCSFRVYERRKEHATLRFRRRWCAFYSSPVEDLFLSSLLWAQKGGKIERERTLVNAKKNLHAKARNLWVSRFRAKNFEAILSSALWWKPQQKRAGGGVLGRRNLKISSVREEKVLKRGSPLEGVSKVCVFERLRRVFFLSVITDLYNPLLIFFIH